MVVRMIGVSSESAGTAGGVPAPPVGQQNYYLSGGGSWQKSLTRTYTIARINIDKTLLESTSTISNLKFLNITSPICPAPFVLSTDSITFTSPNISGTYKIDIAINTIIPSVDLSFTDDPQKTLFRIKPVVDGVENEQSIISDNCSFTLLRSEDLMAPLCQNLKGLSISSRSEVNFGYGVSVRPSKIPEVLGRV